MKKRYDILNWEINEKENIEDILKEEVHNVLFNKMVNKFKFMELLKYIPQDKAFHSEKDVFTHTKMVCEETFKDINEMNIEDKKSRYLSSFFHDLGKLRTTEIDLWDQDETILYFEKIVDNDKRYQLFINEINNQKKIKIMNVLDLIDEGYQREGLDVIIEFMNEHLVEKIKIKNNLVFKMNGKIKSPHHSLVGAQDSRYLLMKLGEDFNVRENIVNLIKNHQKPFFLLSQSENELILKEKVNALQDRVDLDYLFPLALNDLKGRHVEKKESLEKIISDVELLMYEKNDLLENKVVHHKKKTNIMIVLSGLPCVGKDSWIKEWKNQQYDLEYLRQYIEIDEYLENILNKKLKEKDVKILSFDDSKKIFSKNENGFDLNDKLRGQSTQKVYQDAKKFLAEQNLCIWNATNIDKLSRKKIIDLCDDYDCEPIILYFERPLDDILRDNNKRNKTIDNEKIKRMALTIDIPQKNETRYVNYVIEKNKKNLNMYIKKRY